MSDDFDLGELDITTVDVNFDEMEQDIARFAEEPSVKAVLESGEDLQNYSKKIKRELAEIEKASIEDYMRQTKRVEDLHIDIVTCDEVLESMEDLLNQFKGSLGQLSNDICSLQTRSQEITVKLNNRKELEKYLGKYTENVNITKEFSDKVNNTEVGIQYIDIINELGEKIAFSSRSDIKNTPAALESRNKMESLKLKASDNIKKWMMQCVNGLREADEEEQLTIQNSMLRCQPLIKFLKDYSNDYATQIENSYVDVISKIYLDTYKTICKNVMKKMAQISMSPETIVPIQQRSFFKKRVNTGESTLFFSLGDRARLLNDVLGPPQVFGDGAFPVESLMRSLYQKLIDNATAEHAFASYFFCNDNIAASIFAPTCRHLEGFLDELLGKITDPICVTLMLRMNVAQKAEMQRRRCFKIDSHLTNVSHKLTERFRAIVAQNVFSIENADVRAFIEKEETAVHANAMTKRFSEFASSLSQLQSPDISDVMVPELHGISAAVIDLLERTSRELKTDELSAIFLINNYCLILATLKGVPGCCLLDLFEQKFNDCVEHFVDLELHVHFKDLFETVRRAFKRLDASEPVVIDVGERELKAIATEFKDTHVLKMRMIADSQIMRFGDFNNAREILMQLAKRLALYWAKFDQLCKAVVKGGPIPAWRSSMISTQQVVLNIRPLTEGFC